MALEKDELKIAIEDARARQAALVQLLYFIDTQAMNFLRTYITLEAAAVSVIVAATASTWPFRAELIGAACGFLLASLVGSFFCFWTMRTVTIHLPGRGPDFWEWGLRKDVSHDEVAAAYMTSMAKSIEENRKINDSSSRALECAKLLGLLSPFVGLGGGLVAAACPVILRTISS
ncbi:MAG: hypothetical protein KIS73_24980 [Enhydrobacter sp.]|nr:hypothetical protein [Enhydrobacter sp.]